MCGAPPLPQRPAGGWAQSCILEEPAGLFPPAPGLHRTCSGEQSQWTSSGELSDTAPICGQSGWWVPGEAAGRHLCLCLCPSPHACCWGRGKPRVWLSHLYRVQCVAGSHLGSENRIRVRSQCLACVIRRPEQSIRAF